MAAFAGSRNPRERAGGMASPPFSWRPVDGMWFGNETESVRMSTGFLMASTLTGCSTRPDWRHARLRSSQKGCLPWPMRHDCQ